MAVITRISVQAKDKTRCNIEADGRFLCGMKLETVIQNRLKAGMEISEEELAAMQLESEKATALDKALSYLSTSMKTEGEIRAYLERKGYLRETCDAVIEKLRQYGYLDDGAYSAAYVQSASKKKGKRLIRAELRRKGISEEEIENALEEIPDVEESAKQILCKYLRQKSLDEKTVRKAYAYLLGKGFDYETAKEAVRGYFAEEEE